MTSKAKISCGDVFSVEIDETKKKFIQLVATNSRQLGGDVIRAFRSVYAIADDPDISEIVDDEVAFHAHCWVKLGVKMKYWRKVGNSSAIGDPKTLLFRTTNDYGAKVGDEPVKISSNWYVWRIHDYEATKVGKLDGDNRDAQIGLLFSPKGIVELLKGNKYPRHYPAFE